MIFKLALALGKSVKEICNDMDSAEFSEWIAYLNINPLPDHWHMHAENCSLFANANYKGRHPPEKFLPTKRQIKQSPKQIGSALEMFAKRHNRKANK